MWYFAWILGVLLAAAAGVLAGIWYEEHHARASSQTRTR